MAATREALLEESWDQPARGPWLTASDALWALLVLAGSGYAYWLYQSYMDGYEVAIQIGATLALIGWGRYWPPARTFTLAVTGLTVLALWRYGADYELRKSAFLLKYLLESQAAFMWMSTLYVLATVTYFAALFSRSEFHRQNRDGADLERDRDGHDRVTGALARVLSARRGHRPHSGQQSV
jgi:hypothetical protein